MEKNKGSASLLLLLIFVNGFSSALAASPSRIVRGFFYNVLSHLLKRIWTITSNPKTEISGRSQMKFESGYNVETVFDGSKHGIEPFSVEVTPIGELLILDSVNSNMHRISLPLSRYSRPKLVAGSAEGYAGHVDGKPREAKMNHPKGFTVDDSGNIYIADTSNMAIRKISNAGVTTIAGGKWNRGGHIFGPSEEAKLSNDFEVVYISSTCSLLVVDRGNQAIREIQLHVDDCTNKYRTDFPLGIAVLFAAGFFGYMFALLQCRVRGTNSSKDEPLVPSKKTASPLCLKPLKQSVRPPLILSEDERGNQEEGLFTPIGNLIASAKSSVSEIFGAVFFKRRPKNIQHQNYFHQRPMQGSFKIPYEDEPPLPLATRVPTHKKAYASMSKDREKIHGRRQGRAYFNTWNRGELQQQHMRQQHVQKHHQHSLGSQTCYEQSCESMNDIVFGVVQELGNKRRAIEIKAVDCGESVDDLYQYGLRSQTQYNGSINSF